MEQKFYRPALGALLFTAVAFTSSVTGQTAPAPTGMDSGKTAKSDSGKMAGTDSGKMKSMAKGNDQKFAMEAARGGMAEVELGRLAQQKASNADVKQFAQRMVDDHSKANDQLKAAAEKAGITLPTDAGPKHQAMMSRLQGLSGDAFDREYMKHMVQDHKKDVSEFQKQANSGSESNLKEFAQSTLPTLQEHLRMAQEISSKGGNSADRSKNQ